MVIPKVTEWKASLALGTWARSGTSQVCTRGTSQSEADVSTTPGKVTKVDCRSPLRSVLGSRWNSVLVSCRHGYDEKSSLKSKRSNVRCEFAATCSFTNWIGIWYSGREEEQTKGSSAIGRSGSSSRLGRFDRCSTRGHTQLWGKNSAQLWIFANQRSAHQRPTANKA